MKRLARRIGMIRISDAMMMRLVIWFYAMLGFAAGYVTAKL